MRLDDLLAEFDGLDAEERLEVLVEFAGMLPRASVEEQARLEQPGCRVQECQTPVYLQAGLRDGRVHLAAVVPESSPTVRGFVAMLVVGLEGALPEDVDSVPDDLIGRIGLREALGMQRTRGFAGIVARIKREIARAGGT